MIVQKETLSLISLFFLCFCCKAFEQTLERSFHKSRLDSYAQLILLPNPNQPGTLQAHVIFTQQYEVHTHDYEHWEKNVPIFEEDPRFPALWMKYWVDGIAIPIIRKQISQWNWFYVKTKHNCQYFWAADIYWPKNKTAKTILQAEFLVLPTAATKDSFEYINNVGVTGSGSPPFDEISFTFDLSGIARSIPAIGKTNSSFYMQWIYGGFFSIYPKGYRLEKGKVRWQFENVWKIDEKFKVEWYAWYR
ncbi:hypothetical protein A7K93_09980 [Candidatus Methylacidiphilum fumarolicum]|uniref:Uncharacterized protein n=2 Tax=Candidatus Methylacidiphilum fumarolicum TaxID=591154 RepID=I0JVB3_METFB|nr:hypothetical protein [Candidatus Methylacidiphilum fumarolicum]MBW6415991.1 hypothetical protein [Candidatus Methylacidiphilum fumarolicum]TFE66036.1 hypothetical protein A7K73_10810 [Candidatus Methylacidiphilum fumarolicum]TFE71904.1 hypothetical protein A7K93_09980 [Candidatus Methylacidiphilum fumarolicum]TFE73029.1 hypothetical protein A7K72_07405 [Candidatus Methylacidiphilum fumarolicum]TFE76255.1 hypothetical protein A7D33_10625 [Candidatus Methylacidiphilum fumarolicum]